MLRLLSVGAVLALLASPLSGQTLGRIDFPNSGRPEAQAPFLKGVLLLHSFEYEEAARAFREAQAADSGFALAYWGEAMTYTHPLWNEQNQAAARAALERLGPTPAARLARAGTLRERGYLESVEALYFGAGDKPRRDTLYSAVVERLARENPADLEAQAFYALSLMGLSQGTRNVATYMRAGAIAEEIYRKNPLHPGALHYIIHAFDDPIHAPLGLRAAREYSQIATDADHAQHMTTHIFLALGMWRETVSQNAIASGADTSRWRPGHYTAWHNYGLLQLGQFQAARQYLELVRRNLPTPPVAARQNYMLVMRAHYLVNSERWDDGVADWPLDQSVAAPGARAINAYAVGVAALRRGRRAEAEKSLAAIEAVLRTRQGDNGYGTGPRVPDVLAAQLRAQLLWERGKKDQALALLRGTASDVDALPMEFGPPDIVQPTHELIGSLLLADRQYAEAAREFRRALELTPGRSRALLGLAQAARGAGDLAASADALARLDDNWKDADAGLPERAQLDQLRSAR